MTSNGGRCLLAQKALPVVKRKGPRRAGSPVEGRRETEHRTQGALLLTPITKVLAGPLWVEDAGIGKAVFHREPDLSLPSTERGRQGKDDSHHWQIKQSRPREVKDVSKATQPDGGRAGTGS